MMNCRFFDSEKMNLTGIKTILIGDSGQGKKSILKFLFIEVELINKA